MRHDGTVAETAFRLRHRSGVAGSHGHRDRLSDTAMTGGRNVALDG
jgi:hypothetical protein